MDVDAMEHHLSIDDNGFFAVDEAGIRVIRRFLARAYVFGDYGTHWDGCELAHHECAVMRAEKLREALLKAISWAEFTDEQLDELAGLAGIPLFESVPHV